ncbi:uroporphyrinogen decarboxylase [candidate division KSB1 bacterium]
MNSSINDLFLRACRQLPVERTPVWIMRQAGRYLPDYMKIKEKTDFLTLCRTPDLAAEVTIQPVDIIGVDAAIIFSDILVVPEAMGMTLHMETGSGPMFDQPVRSEQDARQLREIDPAAELRYTLDAISLTKKELNGRVPLIGFAGSPWTLLTYMVEGKGSKNFQTVKRMIFEAPVLAHTILEKVTAAVSGFLAAQAESGADAVQIFDTWGGILSQEAYREFSLRYIQQIVDAVQKHNVPVIVFSKGVHHSLDRIAASGADVIGLDQTMDLGEVRAKTNDTVALQGNVDPCALLADRKFIKQEVIRTLESYGYGHGHIFNLGHGILPETDPENAKALVRYVKEESTRFHQEKP